MVPVTSVIVIASTKRGLFLLQSDASREAWQLQATGADPGWSYDTATYDRQTGYIYAAGHSAWYGPAVWRSPDLGQSWSLSSEGLTYGDSGPPLRRIWSLTPAHGRLYAGVDPAGLFQSEDSGQSWTEVGAPLRALPEAQHWTPGSGGLPVHSILAHPADPKQLWLGIAGGGILHTADGGRSWAPRNARLATDQPALRVQRLLADPGRPEHLLQQNHQGIFRSVDGGLDWQDLTSGLPTPFGFPIGLHPGEPPTIYAIPHHNEAGIRYIHGGEIAIWRRRERWERLGRGLPQGTAYATVLRDGMSTDSLPLPGIYFGTSSGSIYGSIDGGETWRCLAERLPEILSIHAAVTDH